MSKERNNKSLWEIRRKFLEDPIIKRSVEKTDLEYQIYIELGNARAKIRMTQQDLARKMGTSQSAVGRYEAGSSNPTLWFIQRMAEALDLKIRLFIEPIKNVD